MTDIYTQENGSKKKFLAPLLVILLCMVSLTAAGYAYSATVDNTGDDVIVDGVIMDFPQEGAIFTVSDIHLATHTTNGKAVWFSENKGFKSGAEEAYNGGPVDTFDQGYYVEVLKGDDSGYFTFTATNDAFEQDESALNDLGVYKVSGVLPALTVTNKSGAAIDLKVALSTAAASVDKGIKDVYIVIKNGEDVIGFESFKEAGAETIVINQASNGTPVAYTVEAYIALSDYQSANAPAIPAAAYSFAISMETVQHA